MSRLASGGRVGACHSKQIHGLAVEIQPKEIRAEREKEACRARNCPSNAEQSTPVSRFPEQTLALSLQSDANVPGGGYSGHAAKHV